MQPHALPIAGFAATVQAFGPKDAATAGIANWSLAPLQCQADVLRERKLANAVMLVLKDLNVTNAYAPNVVSSSGVITTAGSLVPFKLGTKVYLHRKKSLPADGVFLDRANEAFVMSGSGCPIIIATAGPYFIAAQGSRDSLIDRRKASREHQSVVDAIVHAFSMRGMSTSHIRLCMLFSVPWRQFEHPVNDPVHGAYNRALVSFIEHRWPGAQAVIREEGRTCLNLEGLFLAQAQEHGIRHVSTMHSLEEHPELAHTRDGIDRSRRNLYVVKCNI